MSWLVRCWVEPQEAEQGEPVVRCCLRNLRTGEEEYVGDPRRLGDLVLRHLREEGAVARNGEGRAADRLA
ncbi:MAG TPA: hypothetical protein VF173_18620 [Thermoanaerobaculia bacterium]|nr:hypothetical protein [Thermoanaerobaculia bacterium]